MLEFLTLMSVVLCVTLGLAFLVSHYLPKKKPKESESSYEWPIYLELLDGRWASAIRDPEDGVLRVFQEQCDER